MKQTLLFVLFLSTCISIQAQQPKSVSKFVFQTDNGGNIVKKVPVYDEEKTEDLKEKQRQLHVMSLREEIKITVSVSDTEHFDQQKLQVYSSSGGLIAQYDVKQKNSEYSIRQVPKGVYIVTLRIEDSVVETVKTVFR